MGGFAELRGLEGGLEILITVVKVEHISCQAKAHLKYGFESIYAVGLDPSSVGQKLPYPLHGFLHYLGLCLAKSGAEFLKLVQLGV